MNACAVAMTFRCELCQDQRKFYSATLKRTIRCPCCNRRPRQDTSGIRALTKADVDRRQQQADLRAIQQARQLAHVLDMGERAASRAQRLHPLRAPVDRVMQRWAVGEGSGLPYTSDEMDLAAQLASEQADTFTPAAQQSPPLDDETQIIVDRIVLKAPSLTRAITREWYLSPTPARVMAEDLAVSLSTLYRYWHDALDYLRGRFEDSRNHTLLRLIQSPA